MRLRLSPALAALCVASFALAAPGPEALRLDWLDKQVSPAKDFYHFANGGWQKQNPIPPEYGRWGTFDVIRRRTQDVVRGILERAAAGSWAPGSIEQKIGDFYASGMDEAAVDAAGIAPLSGELARIAAVADPEGLEAAIAHLQMIGVGAAFDFGAMADFENSEMTIGVASQGGIGLPDRAYYLEPGFADARKEYVAHVARTLQLAGDTAEAAAAEAAAIMGLETDLAQASLSRAALRDPHAIYHLMDRAALAALTPHFSWPAYFDRVGRPDVQRINVSTPAFFVALDDRLRSVPIATWKAYLRFHLVGAYAPYLSRPFQEEAFHLRSVLTGVQQMLPRWLRVQDAADAVLGFAVGQKYVEEVFPPSAKKAAAGVLHGIRGALADDLATLSWMSQPTREAALVKLSQMGERIGYPDVWRDYSGLTVDRGPWVLNVLRGMAFEVKRELAKIDRPVDRNEWDMTPQTVNAYYDPSTNVINFPAAILQAPFFDQSAPASVNQGAIGFIMGHEITHGFDDEGAQFDGKGNLRNWWAPEDLERFHALTSCVADQFSAFTVEGVHLDGKLVVGEATADLGGITLAYRAFRAAGGREAPAIAGFSGDQQFFLSAAHVWATNVRPEEARLLAATDPHPPPLYRVNGTFANVPALEEAFQIPPGSPMAPLQRCKIW